METNQALDISEKSIDIFDKSGVEYGDIRFVQSSYTGAGKNKEEENIANGNSLGFHLRAFRKGCWRSVGTSSAEKEKILSLAKKLVNFTPAEKPIRMVPQKPWKLDKSTKPKKQLGIEERIKWVRDSFNLIKNHNKKIVDASAGIATANIERIFLNTEGSKLREVFPRSRVILFALAKEGRNIQQDFYSVGKIMGDELIDQVNMEETSSEICTNAVKLLKAEQAPSGSFDVILGGEMSGLVAHESFGHGTEADQVLRNRSFLKDYYGKRIAEDFVTIVDNGSVKEEFGSFSFDDEGIKPDRTAMIEDGIFKSFLHSRETASAMNMNVTGNGRAQDFARKVYVRMTNTYFEPGKWKVEELFKGIKFGVYLEKDSHGMEDPEGGGIQVSARLGWIIENGEKTRMIRGCALSGKLLDVLKNIDAVADDFALRPGNCGKGHEDSVPVTTGGSHMRIRGAIIGGG